ncbi:TrkA C-terminal domain-containing protein [Dactylosporangium sp. NPDC049742]|uniref:cation:proton antiporter regulatory subunit n=1 Tax=Dactylosporangium sp. NPDC049742 TaxID=3154737 RepID=UPI00342228BB
MATRRSVPRTTSAPLPGIGTLHVLAARDGHHVGVIRHDDDRRELVVYDPADPDTRLTGVLLTAAEARTVAELVGTTGPMTHCARLDRHTDGVAVLQVLIGADSPRVGRPLTGTGVAGATVIAVVRDEHVVPSPGQDLRCRAGDIVVVIGRPDAAFEVIDSVTAA